jgi:zinc protease
MTDLGAPVAVMTPMVPTLHRRRLLAALGAFALPWPVAARPVAALSVPKLPLTQRVLGNGLTVISIPDRTSAIAAVQVWMRVGGKDDPPGRSGFAHLFEHLMFKGTRHMKAETFDRLTEDVGGQNNAFTAEDVTAYISVVPSNHLERLLWAESERMAHLSVEEATFRSERDVVKEEYRERVLADPYGRLFNALPGLAFDRHPYRRPVIGSIEDLEAATLDDVRAFHATYYRPDNAVLIVAGDFDAPQLDAWVERYFAGLSRPDKPIPRVTVKEPRRTESRRVALQGANVPLPAVALLWQGPPAASRDAPALQIASSLLSSGESSRLHQSLVYRDRIAQAAGFAVDLHADAGMLAAYAIGASGHDPRKLEAALVREVKRLADGPVKADELEKGRTRLVTSELVGRQSPQGKAEAVGWAVILHGNANAADREIADLQAVTAADVQRVLKQLVLDRPRVSVTYTREGGK